MDDGTARVLAGLRCVIRAEQIAPQVRRGVRVSAHSLTVTELPGLRSRAHVGQTVDRTDAWTIDACTRRAGETDLEARACPCLAARGVDRPRLEKLDEYLTCHDIHIGRKELSRPGTRRSF